MNEIAIQFLVDDIQKLFELKYPLNIYELLKNLNFRIEFINLGNMDGCLLSDKNIIAINKSLINQDKRKNFTLAHELGHYFLQHHNSSLYLCTVNPNIQTYNIYDENKEFEKEADFFASELLLPKNIVDKIEYYNLMEMEKISDDYNISLPALAIKTMEFQKIPLVFIYFKSNKISWVKRSKEEFANCLKLEKMDKLPIEFTMSQIQEVSSDNWVKSNYKESNITIYTKFYPNYDYGYLLIDLTNFYKENDLL